MACKGVLTTLNKMVTFQFSHFVMPLVFKLFTLPSNLKIRILNCEAKTQNSHPTKLSKKKKKKKKKKERSLQKYNKPNNSS